MRKILALIMILLLCGVSTAKAEIAITPEVDIQILRLYDTEIMGTDMEIEREAQTYLLGADITLGNLLVRPKVGVQFSNLDVAEILEIENDTGIAAGVDIEYDIFGWKNLKLVLTGSYLFSQTEVDQIRMNGVTLDNFLRNDMTCHDYEVGGKVTAEFLAVPIKPYVAVVYSDSDLKLTSVNLPIDLEEEAESSENLGIRLGAEGSPMENFSVKAEVALLDQTAVMFSGAWKF